MKALTSHDVDTISAMTDIAARNLLVTEGYFYLGQRLADWIGAEGNWCSFAGWASRQAGRSIRGEDLARHVSRHLNDGKPALMLALREAAAALRIDKGALLGAIGEAVLRTRGARRSSEAVARGNVKVFSEIGRVLARFLSDIPSGDAGLQAFCESIPGGPPPEGQGLLREALTLYAKASSATGAKAKAEFILFGNLKIGFHEQTRLQPEIEDSIEGAAITQKELEIAILEALERLRPAGSASALRATLRQRLASRLAAESLAIVRAEITARLMVIEMPGGETVRLGDDHRRELPMMLNPLENQELRAFLATVDPSLDTSAGSGARDWADFPERMHFIAELFCRYQTDPFLTPQPAGGLR